MSFFYWNITYSGNEPILLHIGDYKFCLMTVFLSTKQTASSLSIAFHLTEILNCYKSEKFLCSVNIKLYPGTMNLTIFLPKLLQKCLLT